MASCISPPYEKFMKNQTILAEIDKAFRQANTILLTASENLDGDALGCMLALDDFAKSLGKDSTIVNGKRVSDFYQFLGVGDRVVTEIPNKPYDLIIVCDTGDIEMIGRIYGQNTALFENTKLINIDHHHSDYGDICYVDSEVTSACDIVADFIEYSGGLGAITKEMANYLLLGIVYDSGSYRNSNVSEATFHSSAKLMSCGANILYIVRGMFQSMSVNRAKLFGEVLMNIRSLGNGVCIGAVVTKEMLARYEIEENSIGNVLVNDYIR